MAQERSWAFGLLFSPQPWTFLGVFWEGGTTVRRRRAIFDPTSLRGAKLSSVSLSPPVLQWLGLWNCRHISLCLRLHPQHDYRRCCNRRSTTLLLSVYKEKGSHDEHHFLYRSVASCRPEIYRLNITVCSIIQKKRKKNKQKKTILALFILKAIYYIILLYLLLWVRK